jgi:hypothetical protein
LCSLIQEKHFTGYSTIIAEIAGAEKDTGLVPAFIEQGANSRVTITKRNKFHLKLEISTNGIPDTASKTNVRVIAHGRNLFPAESREIFDVNYEIGVYH